MATKAGNSTIWIIVAIVAVLVVGGMAVIGAAVCAGLAVSRWQESEAKEVADCLDRIAKVDAAVNAYKIKYGNWPDNLDDLLEPGPDGAPALLDDADVLNDPWGDEFEYDIAGPRNNGVRPDIWSDSHDETGNWQLPRAPKPGRHEN